MTLDQYPELLRMLGELPEPDRRAHLRNLARTDLYFLLRYLLNRPDVEHPWVFDRCKEVEANPNGFIDLWAREHFKSTIITFAKTIQDILSSHGDEPLPEWLGREVTIGIFSFNRGMALDFVGQIKREFEDNIFLIDLFPDILYTNPARMSPSWSQMGGLTVKRRSNPREATVEGWGLVDSMPTGAHFFIRVYDDAISEKFVTNEEMVKKATDSWALSVNLGARGGYERYIGTRYASYDTYQVIIDRETAIPRIYPATIDGTVDGEPVLLTKEQLAKKYRDMGPYIFSAQMLQNPKADTIDGFDVEWLRYYTTYDKESFMTMNRYLICDPASEKKAHSDYTTMGVVALGPDGNYYLVDAIRDRLNLTERTEALFKLHRKWRPNAVGYEKYGKDSDIEHIESEQRRLNYHFDIIALGGSSLHKNDRIRKLIPLFEHGRFYLPASLHYITVEGKNVELIETFKNFEYIPFPFGGYDDFFDMLARIVDDKLGASFPMLWEEEEPPKRYSSKPKKRSWMTK